MTQLANYIKMMRKQFGLTQLGLSQKSGVGLRLSKAKRPFVLIK